MKRGKRILIVAAHPDDEILGCGATVARLITECLPPLRVVSTLSHTSSMILDFTALCPPIFQ